LGASNLGGTETVHKKEPGSKPLKKTTTKLFIKKDRKGGVVGGVFQEGICANEDAL